jgi:hypothetical protein
MFGIEIKITDSTLYLLNDMVENQLIRSKEELDKLPKENHKRRDFLIAQIEYYEKELNDFKSKIDKLLSYKFQFSMEELYNMYGQFENKHLNIEFHKFSQSAQKFGRNISGTLLYYKREREELEEIISKENVKRTNGLVKIDCSNDNNLTKEQKRELAENGFISGDIFEILTLNLPTIKSFNVPGPKEIPNTITVNIDPTDFDPNRAYLWLYGQRIKNGSNLINEEIAKYCGISLFFEENSKSFDFIKQNGFDADGNKLPLVRFYELEAKLLSLTINGEEIFELNKILGERKEIRTEQVRVEIKKSTNKKLEQFFEEYPQIKEEINNSIVHFQTESLVYHDMVLPIYWDFEGYLHIYLRHCDELEIEGHFENKTKFQYTKKDIKRILKIAIEKLRPRINERLKDGLEFRVYGDRSLYFNGNHYSLSIQSNGRVAAFHPMENPENNERTRS